MEGPGIKTIAAFTADPWESALPVLRYTGPAQAAGLQVLCGNQGEQVVPETVLQADLVIIQRDFPQFTEGYERVLELARAASKPVVYEIDDLLLQLPPDHLARANISDVLLPMLRAAIEADAVTVSTPRLRDYLLPFNPDIWVLPNYLNDRLWSFRDAPPALLEDRPLVIGYMGGETHLADLEMVVPVLQAILQQYGGRVLLRFWGGKPPASLLGLPQVQWVPLQLNHYAEFARFFAIQYAHVLIAPLREDEFNSAKSAIKFLEYGTLGVPGVYSRLPTYQAVVQDGVNGLLAGSLDEWHSALVRLVDDPDLRLRVGRAAQDSVRENWLLSHHYQEWEYAYREIARQCLELQARREQPHVLNVVGQVARQVEARQQELHRAVQALNERVAQQEKTLAEQHQVIEAQNQEIQGLNARLAQSLGELQTTQNQLNDILNSQSWKVMQAFTRLRLALMPWKKRKGPG